MDTIQSFHHHYPSNFLKPPDRRSEAIPAVQLHHLSSIRSIIIWSISKAAASSSSSSSSGKERKKPATRRSTTGSSNKDKEKKTAATTRKIKAVVPSEEEEEAVHTRSKEEEVMEDEEEDDADYDEEEELSEEIRALLNKPAMGLSELLQEAGMEFGDPTLMDEGNPDGFKAGFVSIVGSPNVGKSTLMNALMGERMSIVTSKQQTTRHQIMGVVTGSDYQTVYYDTPGVLQPNYKLQEGMMGFVKESLSDADVILMMTDVFENPNDFPDQEIFEQMKLCKRPILLAVNKIDVFPNATHPMGKLGKDALAKVGQLEDVIGRWQEALPQADIVPISAMDGINLSTLLEKIKADLPLSPPLYPNDTLTDKPQRFFASEIIREKIFLSYSKEIPYSCEVVVTAFKDEPRLLRINSTIFTTRDSHKPILIGTKGSKLKEVGTAARHDLEAFFDKKVFLEMTVKVRKDWRSREEDLLRFGYLPEKE